MRDKTVVGQLSQLAGSSGIWREEQSADRDTPGDVGTWAVLNSRDVGGAARGFFEGFPRIRGGTDVKLRKVTSSLVGNARYS